jgi:autotransporter-associated beta strand protein
MKKLIAIPSAIAAVLLVGSIVNASAATWQGTHSLSWNDPLNWDSGSVPDAVSCGISMVGNGSSTFTATITNDVAGKPVEIVIGGWYSTGRVDHRAGTLGTENLGWPPGWVLIGYGAEGHATYNLADTTTTGGTLTGFGTGSGTLNIVNSLFMGEPGGGDGNGVATLNVNTTGALNMNNDFNLGVSGWNATVNLDAGAIYSTSGNIWIPAGVNNNTNSTTSGTLNEAGGSVDCALKINVGSADTSFTNLVGTVNLNGGTMTTHGVNWWDGGVRIGANGGRGTFNLNGGTLTTLHVYTETNNGTGGTSIFNFNGGTLKARASYNVPWSAFFGGFQDNSDGRCLTAAYVQAGGAIIDTAGFDNYIGQPLLTGTNITDGGLTKNGNGQLEINNTNTFTGPMVVNGGTLFTSIGGAASRSTTMPPFSPLPTVCLAGMVRRRSRLRSTSEARQLRIMANKSSG